MPSGGLGADPPSPSGGLWEGWGFSARPPSQPRRAPCLTPAHPGPTSADSPLQSSERASVPAPRGVPTPPSHADIKGKQEAVGPADPSRREKSVSRLSPGPNCWGFSIPSGCPQDAPTLAFESPQEPGFGQGPGWVAGEHGRDAGRPLSSVSLSLAGYWPRHLSSRALGPGWGGMATDSAEGPSPSSHSASPQREGTAQGTVPSPRFPEWLPYRRGRRLDRWVQGWHPWTGAFHGGQPVPAFVPRPSGPGARRCHRPCGWWARPVSDLSGGVWGLLST